LRPASNQDDEIRLRYVRFRVPELGIGRKTGQVAAMSLLHRSDCCVRVRLAPAGTDAVAAERLVVSGGSRALHARTVVLQPAVNLAGEGGSDRNVVEELGGEVFVMGAVEMRAAVE
jgi:hypothetical protein